jgi:hypothetical protein
VAVVKRSPNKEANCDLAMDHSRGGMIYCFSERFKTRNSNFVAAAPGPDGSAKLGIQRLGSICGVQNPADVTGKSIERSDFVPGPPPDLPDRRIFLAPKAVLKALSAASLAAASTAR